MFDKYELETMKRAMERAVRTMRDSKFIGKEDPHLLKCVALLTKVTGLARSAA